MSSQPHRVVADGCFDPLHYGHIRYLRAAAALGGDLLVNVASDEVIRAKGREPLQTRLERLHVLGAIKGVWMALDRDLPHVIRSYAPTYLVKGVEWVGKLPPDVIRACLDSGTTIIYTDTQERTSTERLAG